MRDRSTLRRQLGAERQRQAAALRNNYRVGFIGTLTVPRKAALCES